MSGIQALNVGLNTNGSAQLVSIGVVPLQIKYVGVHVSQGLSLNTSPGLHTTEIYIRPEFLY